MLRPVGGRGGGEAPHWHRQAHQPAPHCRGRHPGGTRIWSLLLLGLWAGLLGAKEQRQGQPQDRVQGGTFLATAGSRAPTARSLHCSDLRPCACGPHPGVLCKSLLQPCPAWGSSPHPRSPTDPARWAVRAFAPFRALGSLTALPSGWMGDSDGWATGWTLTAHLYFCKTSCNQNKIRPHMLLVPDLS
ncbi:unnamed protein product [Nyctereutes procyonoides]|uniref:(raccoon dog) hypothetical protein n=1 Tax=Nyctereutes procyonoides TaxID=34880 RepID=A0A811Z835_NYCPR|nr:unnamed protein product [Nyctereutes procyonoides]